MAELVSFGLLILAIAALNFLAKLIIIRKYPIYSPDEFTHLEIIRWINGKKKIPEVFDTFLIDKKYKLPFAYPFLMHYMFSFFPIEVVSKYRKEITILLDTANIVLVGVFSYLTVGQILPVVIFAILSFLLPYQAIESIRFTPRPISYLIINIVIALTAIGSLSTFQSPYLFAFITVGVLFTSIIFMHKFSTQALIVGTFAISLVSSEAQYGILVMFSTVLLLLFYFRKPYVRIIKEHFGCIKKSYWYCNTLDFKYKQAAILIASAPFFLLLYFWLNQPGFFTSSIINKIFLFWTFSLYLAAYTTIFIKQLRCLGEGERYITYAMFPLTFLIAAFLINNGTQANFILTALSVLVILGTFLVFFKVKILGEPHLTRDIYKLCKKIKRLPKPNMWILSKDQALDCVVAHFAQKNIVNTLNISFYGTHPQIFTQMEQNIGHAVKEFNINYILADGKNLRDKKSSLKGYKKIIKSGKYCVLETKI